MKIAIIGGGIGGLALGILAQKRGWHTETYEQFKFSKPVGSGFMLQKASFIVLEALGILEDVRKNSVAVEGVIGDEAAKSLRILEVNFKKEDQGLSVARPLIHKLLLKKYIALGGIMHLDHIFQRTENKEIYFNNQTTASGFDLIVDARGVSALRSDLNARDLPYGAIWGNLNVPVETHGKLTQKYIKAHQMLGMMPLTSSPPKTAIFWSLKCADYETWKADGKAKWVETAAQIWPYYSAQIDTYAQMDQLTFASYVHATRKQAYNMDCVYIGDAWMASSPQLGQGANMALLDAFTLDRALSKYGADKGRKAYFNARKWHRWSYQALSYIFTPLYQSDKRYHAFIRDSLLAPMLKFPPTQWILARLMSGYLLPPIIGLKG